MGFEAFEHYLSDDSRRGPAPEGAFSGAAGGPACGDLVRVSLAVERGRVVAPRASTPRAARRRTRPARRSPSWPRAPACWRRRGSAPAEISAEASAGSRRRAATPPSWPRTRFTARSVRRPRRASALADPPASGDRVLVAMSGGVDSAVAALLERERGAEVVAVTLKLWADRHNDGARSCCSPEAVVGARALAHWSRPAPPDARPRGRVSGHRRRRVPARLRGGADAEPLRGLQRRAADRRDARPRASGSARPRSPPATTLGSSTTARGRCLAAPADAAKDQTYMLSALRPDSLAAAALPARRPDQAAGARARRRRRAPGGRQAREPGPLLPRRRGQALVPRPARAAWASGPARSSTARAGSSGATAGTTTSPSASAAASASPPASRSTSWPPTRPRTGSWSARARSWPPGRVRVRDAVLRRDGGAGGPGQAPLPLAADRAARSRRGAGRHAGALRSSWPSPPTASRPGRPPA